MTAVAVDNSGLPANDLVHNKYGVLDPEMAFDLYQNEGVDLSKLNPVANDLWDGKDHFDEFYIDREISVNTNDELKYNGKINSFSGMFRFNATNEDGKRIQVHLSKNIHTVLLRKNLLRKLGYIVPRMKYIPKLKVQFKNAKEKNDFKDIDLVFDLGLAPGRWIVSEGDDFLVLQDVVVKEPSETDGLDIALTMIPEKLTSRALRGALLAYTLVDLDESINKFPYQAIAKQESNFILTHDTEAEFNATLDDIKWLGEKISKLTRFDFEEIVEASAFPYVVSKLLVERLIARRNSIVDILKLDAPEMKYTKKLNLQGVEDGFLHTEVFPGYATRFSSGVQKGPLDDIWRYGLSELQSTVISSAVDMLNDELRVFSNGEARYKWLLKDFEENKEYAIKYFTEHGEFPALPMSSWNTPVLNGNLILGRDIVIGGALGTDNFVQLADTAGLSVSIGWFFGLERVINQVISGSVFPNMGVLLSYSHVKPISSMKQALSEPYKNILVNWLTRRLRKNFESVGKTDSMTSEDRYSEISKIYEKISKELGIGESLIISENFVPDVSLSLKGPLIDGSSITGTVGSRFKVLKRIQVYRKSKFEFQVYFDDGNIKELYMRGGLNYLIPILSGESKKAFGTMNMNYYSFNFDPNLNDNPDFYKNVAKFVSILENRDTEAVADFPVKVTSKINDGSTKFSFLFYVSKWAKKLTDMLVKFKGAEDTRFVSSTYGNKSGFNYVNFFKDVANYYLQMYSNFFSFDVDPHRNLGRNLYGTAYTTDVRFEAKLKDVKKDGDVDNFSTMYATYLDKTEGGSISQKRLWKKMKKVNEKFQREIFTGEHSNDAGDLSLYKIESKLHFFDKAVKKMLFASSEDIKKLEKAAQKHVSARCYHNNEHGGSKTIAEELRCGDYDHIERFARGCLNKFYDDEIKDGQKCIARLVYYYAHYVNIDDLIDFVGIDNIYLESSVNGFRKNHEYIYKPIAGNSFGRRNSKYKTGPFDAIKKFLGVLGGELDGNWFRERL
ncbi:hypothetical protein M900_A0130 [Bacteriovorax sp. Seq25_V]|nr:hypothetical protein M900_A0130 [Bacteriovorax sp. Seq25_V]